MTPTVFIVDDDAPVRDSLCLLLEAAGFTVESYADGPAFLAACAADRAGCVVLDVAMPGMSGYEVQAALNERGSRMPVIFLSGHGDGELASRALAAGAVAFLEKPVRSGTLLEWVEYALERDAERRRER